MSGEATATQGPELPRYQSHKVVQALKIREVATVDPFVGDPYLVLFPEDLRYGPLAPGDAYFSKHKPEAGGYYVRYADGYESYSPAKAFEDGYTLIEPLPMVTQETDADAARRFARRVLELEEQKDGAYTERNRIVALLAAEYPSVLARHPDSNATWEDDWRWLVQIELPTGQATWHIHDSHLPLFAHVPRGENRWDGHSTEEKYRRIEELIAELSRQIPATDG